MRGSSLTAYWQHAQRAIINLASLIAAPNLQTSRLFLSPTGHAKLAARNSSMKIRMRQRMRPETPPRNPATPPISARSQ